ncbi:MAG: alpha-amylase family glycosyl hydrolase, partial [Balneolales bacterium]|nr:alpha-amylase family glycosyl hydrolase [Balneolales bacterium]
MKLHSTKALVFLLVLFLFQSIHAGTKERTVDIVSAMIVSPNEVRVVLSQNLQPESVSLAHAGNELPGMVIAESEKTYLVITDEKLDYTKRYVAQVGDRTRNAQVHWEAIDAMYTYEGELGMFYTSEETEFKLWAPLATEVELQLFKEGNGTIPYSTVNLERGEKGVWSTTVSGDLFGEFYSYLVTNYGETKEVIDPYAKSKGVDDDPGVIIGKAAILDPSLIGPELNFADIEGYEKREDAIIWEIHVRDFTVDPDIETEARFGTYGAFTERLDYIRDLGVTHVQLLPVMSYAHGNELAASNREFEFATSVNYNWGYDPHGYFAPDGMYLEDPTDPALRIRELKELINAVHAEGLGVTLDVVYNHTARVSIFEDIVPGYYHFMDSEGNTKESYGGGRVGTTHAMARKLVIDSILY